MTELLSLVASPVIVLICLVSLVEFMKAVIR